MEYLISPFSTLVFLNSGALLKTKKAQCSFFFFFLQAKPLFQEGCVEKLLDPRVKFSQKYSNHVTQMVQAATACLHNEESRRPSINEIIAILRGGKTNCSSRKRANLASSSSCVTECYPQLQQTKSEMRSHLALAMLGVVEFEDDDHLYCR